MKPFKVRHKGGRGRPSKEMKLMEAIINEPKAVELVEKCTMMAFKDMIVWGQVRPETQEKIDKMITTGSQPGKDK